MRHLRYKPSDKILLQALQKQRADLNKLKSDANSALEEDLWAKLYADAKHNNSTRFWSTINKFIYHNPDCISSNITVVVWVKYFRSHFQQVTERSEQYQACLNEPACQTTFKAWAEINLTVSGERRGELSTEDLRANHIDAIKRQIRKGRREGAPGPNGIPQVLFKQEATFWAEALDPLFRVIRTLNILPSSWRGSII